MGRIGVVAAGLALLCLCGCGEAGDIDLPEPVAEEEPVAFGDLNLRSGHAVPELADLSPSGRPLAVSASGLASEAGEWASAGDGVLYEDSWGGLWVDCEAFDALAGIDLFNETPSGRLRVRYAPADGRDGVFAVWDGRVVASLDSLSEWFPVYGLASGGTGIEAGGAVSERDKAVLDSVLAAMDAQDGDAGSVVAVDCRLMDRYWYDGRVYALDPDSLTGTDLLPEEPLCAMADGRRAWAQKDGLIIESDGGAYLFLPVE